MSKPPRSILKPTISSLPEIPPLKKRNTEVEAARNIRSPSKDELSESRIAVKTEEEQQAAAREREERDRRDARRKSLANRRVSFAAEATLHTFHEVEFMQDSTTSTDSSRRTSQAPSNASNHDASVSAGRDSTPQEQLSSEPDSPDNQRELHQKKRRRSSGAPAMSFGNHQDDDTATSTIYSSDSEPADAVEEVIEEEDDEDSNSDSDDGTMMTMVTEEVTGTSVASGRSFATNDESSTLDEVLRLAARHAGTQHLDEDDSDEEEVIPSFGWVKKGNQQTAKVQEKDNSTQQSEPASNQEGNDTEMDMDMDMDMDITHAVGKILKPQTHDAPRQDDDMSMDVTRAFGGILTKKPEQSVTGSSNDQDDEAIDEAIDEATMEFTTAIGGIHRVQEDESLQSDDNEDMSMEFTQAVGGVLSQKNGGKGNATRRRTVTRKLDVDQDDSVMDMTVAVGRIISSANPDEEEEEEDNADMTMGMEITTAIGGILSAGPADSRTTGRRIMEEEADKPDTPGEEIMAAASPSPAKNPRELFGQASAAQAEDSPGLSAFRGNGLRRSAGPAAAAITTPTSRSRTPSPAKVSTPKAKTPSPTKTSLKSPAKSTRPTPQSKSPIRPQSRTPQRLSSRTPSPIKSAQRTAPVFHDNPMTGIRTPTIVLTPQKRRLSGLGADREGLGSPRVAALFDRRESIGNAAVDFVPGKRGVTFNNHHDISQELDDEVDNREEKQKRQSHVGPDTSGPREDKDATLNLREMIDSLSPTRKPLRSRKSLHVGSARGLLGKRPVELDDEEEAEDNDGVKRLRGHQSSPVKNVKLQHHPAKPEASGRLTRSFRRSLDQVSTDDTASFSSPLKKGASSTPRNHARFQDIRGSQTIHDVSFQQSPASDEAEVADETDENRIHLQDFLDMTSIRFMELNTTKRRHTVAPGSLKDGSLFDGQDDLSLERCVVAGACTVPMLELYQHSCRELKKYIAEGRNMVKEIEMETFQENPHLFKEYMSATPEVKALMDNQFKNVKTHARLLSKAMWYEWRMKLQEGLREGLVKIAQGMEEDEKLLQEQQDILNSVMPALTSRFEQLFEESQLLEEAARELADCDPEELQANREELMALDEDIEQKKRLIEELRAEFDVSEASVKDLRIQKEQCLADIEDSEKIREECRGWTSTEVNTLKGKLCYDVPAFNLYQLANLNLLKLVSTRSKKSTGGPSPAWPGLHCPWLTNMRLSWFSTLPLSSRISQTRRSTCGTLRTTESTSLCPRR